jgi:hypothetical protein
VSFYDSFYEFGLRIADVLDAMFAPPRGDPDDPDYIEDEADDDELEEEIRYSIFPPYEEEE